jgi:uracil-DNA glycosylase
VDFTDGVIDIINAEKQNVVFLLWGAYAYKKAVLIDNNKHLVLTATHPSPFSAHKGFFGCKHFSKANKYLKMHELKQINW